MHAGIVSKLSLILHSIIERQVNDRLARKMVTILNGELTARQRICGLHDALTRPHAQVKRSLLLIQVKIPSKQRQADRNEFWIFTHSAKRRRISFVIGFYDGTTVPSRNIYKYPWAPT